MATEEREQSDGNQILDGLEHVELEPEAQKQREDEAEAAVESKSAQAEAEVGGVDTQATPQNEENEDRREAESGEQIGNEPRRPLLRLAEHVMNLWTSLTCWCRIRIFFAVQRELNRHFTQVSHERVNK